MFTHQEDEGLTWGQVPVFLWIRFRERGGSFPAGEGARDNWVQEGAGLWPGKGRPQALAGSVAPPRHCTSSSRSFPAVVPPLSQSPQAPAVWSEPQLSDACPGCRVLLPLLEVLSHHCRPPCSVRLSLLSLYAVPRLP